MKTKAQKRRNARDNKIVQLHEQGLRASEIAIEVGCSTVTVYKTFQKRGIPVNKVTDEERVAMATEYENSDLTYQEIADKYGVSYHSVYVAHQMHKSGIRTSPKQSTKATDFSKGKASLDKIAEVFNVVRASGVTIEQLTAYAELHRLLGATEVESTPKAIKDIHSFLDVVID